MATRWLGLLALAMLLATPAGAVLIDGVDGTINTSAPADDPGWANVGIAGGATGVYLGNGHVLTANHVSTGGSVKFGSVSYTEVPGTAVRISNGDGTFADLKVFLITPAPPLPTLAIRANPSLPTGDVIMIGHGRERGAATSSNDPMAWQVPTPPNVVPDPPIEGYLWPGSKKLRWGKNRIVGMWPAWYHTSAFYSVFDAPGMPDATTHEAQAANGDSGGAVFAKDGANWELAGIMLAVANYSTQFPNVSSLHGNQTGAANLSFYRDEIIEVTDLPEPAQSLMLGAGLSFLATLGRRRMRP